MTGLRLVERIKVNCRRSRGVARANNADINMATAFADHKRVRRELDQAGGRRRRRIKFAEQAMFFLADSGAEIKGVRIATGPTVTKSQSPQLIDCDAVAVFVLDRAEERACRRV